MAAKVSFGKMLSRLEHNVNFNKFRLLNTSFSVKEYGLGKGILKITEIGDLRSIIFPESNYNQMKV
jgi:hypothetical protein